MPAGADDAGVHGDVPVGPTCPSEVPDGQAAELHRVGLAQEFDMSGSGSVRHDDLGSSETDDGPLPGPDESRDGGLNPGREQQQNRATGMPAGRADGR